MAFGYCVHNECSGLAASAFNCTEGAPSDLSTRANFNDGLLGRQVVHASAGQVSVVVDLGSAKSIVAAAWLNHNAASLATAQFRVYASSASDFSSDIVTVKDATPCGTARVERKDIVLNFPAVSRRYWLLRVVLGSAGVLKVGELFLGAAVTSLTRGSSYGSGEGAEIVASSLVTQSGDVRVAKLGGPVFERRYSFADWTASELEELHALWDAANGTVTPFLWIDRVASSSSAGALGDGKCLYGRIQDARFDWVQDDFGIYQPPSLVLRSLGREMGA